MSGSSNTFATIKSGAKCRAEDSAEIERGLSKVVRAGTIKLRLGDCSVVPHSFGANHFNPATNDSNKNDTRSYFNPSWNVDMAR